MLGNKVVAVILEKSEESLVVLNISLENLFKSGKRNLFIYTDLIELFLGELREIRLDINHAVGDDLDLLIVVNLDEYDRHAGLLDFNSLFLGNDLALVGNYFAGERSNNRLGKSCADNTVKQRQLLIILVSADSGNIVTVRIKEQIVKMSLCSFKSCRLAGTELFEYLHKSFLGILRLILLKRCLNSGIISEKFTDISVGAESEGSDKCCDKDLPVLVYTDIEKIIYIGLVLKPCASVGDNRVRVKLDTCLIMSHIVVNARRTNKL